MASKGGSAIVGVIMGSKSDYEDMSAACQVMTELPLMMSNRSSETILPPPSPAIPVTRTRNVWLPGVKSGLV